MTLRFGGIVVTVFGAFATLVMLFCSLGICRTWNFQASGGTFDLRLFDIGSTEILADTVGTGITTFLAAGPYFIRVEERGNDGSGSYFLNVDFQ